MNYRKAIEFLSSRRINKTNLEEVSYHNLMAYKTYLENNTLKENQKANIQNEIETLYYLTKKALSRDPLSMNNFLNDVRFHQNTIFRGWNTTYQFWQKHNCIPEGEAGEMVYEDLEMLAKELKAIIHPEQDTHSQLQIEIDQLKAQRNYLEGKLWYLTQYMEGLVGEPIMQLIYERLEREDKVESEKDQIVAH